MPRFAANLSLMYQEHAFLDRFAAAAADGFRAVEYLFPYAFPAAEIVARLDDLGLAQVLFNAWPGDWDGGDRGLACLAERSDELRRTFVEQVIPYAVALRCPRVHLMAGLAPTGADRARLRATYVDNVAWAAAQAATAGLDLLLEPINTRDIPGYFVNRQDEAHAVVAEVGAANLRVQMDLYHCQIVEGDLTTKIERYVPTGRVGHVQVAGVPGRNEPDTGEIDYAHVFATLDAAGYTGHVGCEYRPRAGTTEGLGWFSPYRDDVR
jgi:hydroxypyruvate isomerase